MITHNIMPMNVEKRFDSNMTIGDLKKKLVLVVGTSCENMIIQHRNAEGEVLCTLQPDSEKLSNSEFQLKDFSNIHIVDISAKANDNIVNQLHAYDLGKLSEKDIPKYQLNEEEYNKRPDTFSKWKEANLKQFEMEKQQQKLKKEEEAKLMEDDQLNIINGKKIKVNERCEIKDKGFNKRGVVKFVGKTQFANGYWVGIQLDEPYGLNDGSVKGVRYFECPDKYGKFLKPDAVECGDFPVIDELHDISDEENTEL